MTRLLVISLAGYTSVASALLYSYKHDSRARRWSTSIGIWCGLSSGLLAMSLLNYGLIEYRVPVTYIQDVLVLVGAMVRPMVRCTAAGSLIAFASSVLLLVLQCRSRSAIVEQRQHLIAAIAMSLAASLILENFGPPHWTDVVLIVKYICWLFGLSDVLAECPALYICRNLS